MKNVLLTVLVSLLCAAPCLAQERIYRCGNEYTNTVPTGHSTGCKLVEGGNVTVVQGTRVKKTTDKSPPIQGVAPVASVRVDSQDQKARDLDSRLILQSELKKAEARQQELVKEFNNGEPEKRADESRNYQKYLDRVNEIKTSMARNESDLGGIRRELSRLPATASSK